MATVLKTMIRRKARDFADVNLAQCVPRVVRGLHAQPRVGAIPVLDQRSANAFARAAIHGDYRMAACERSWLDSLSSSDEYSPTVEDQTGNAIDMTFGWNVSMDVLLGV